MYRPVSSRDYENKVNIEERSFPRSLPSNTPQMIHSNVTYIKSKPYHYEYTYREMIQQFLQTGLANFLLQHYKNPQPFSERFAQELSRSRYYPKPITQNELDVDVAITKQMHNHVLEFLA